MKYRENIGRILEGGYELIKISLLLFFFFFVVLFLVWILFLVYCFKLVIEIFRIVKSWIFVLGLIFISNALVGKLNDGIVEFKD